MLALAIFIDLVLPGRDRGLAATKLHLIQMYALEDASSDLLRDPIVSAKMSYLINIKPGKK
jgi:hypothetical protein